MRGRLIIGEKSPYLRCKMKEEGRGNYFGETVLKAGKRLTSREREEKAEGRAELFCERVIENEEKRR